MIKKTNLVILVHGRTCMYVSAYVPTYLRIYVHTYLRTYVLSLHNIPLLKSETIGRLRSQGWLNQGSKLLEHRPKALPK